MADRSPLLLAHAMAWPLGSTAAYDARLTRVDRDDLPRGGGTGRVAEGLEAYLRPRSRGDSLERIQRVRDVAWFRTGPETEVVVPLHALLDRIGDHFLRSTGSGFELKGDENGCGDSGMNAREDTSGRIVAWRWFSLLFPSDYVVAAAAARAGGAAYLRSDRVVLVTPRLSALLRERGGAAETHMHLGAGMDFGTLWSTAMANISALPLRPIDASALKDDTDRIDFDAYSVAGPGKGRTLGLSRLLVVAAWARLVLADHVSRPRKTWRDSVDEAVRTGAVPFGARRPIAAAIENVSPVQGVPLTVVQDALARTVAQRRVRAGLAPLTDQDPLDLVLPPESLTRSETLLARDVLLHLASTPPGKEHDAVALAFWQYVRIRCAAFRLVVQEPGTGGLDWFTRHTRRIRYLRTYVNPRTERPGSPALQRQAWLDARVLQEAFTNQRGGLDLHSMEVRKELTTDPRAYLRDAYAVATRDLPVRDGALPTEVGIVYHIKKRGDSWDDGPKKRGRRPTSARNSGFRYRDFFEAASKATRALEDALRLCPAIVLAIRGVDVCSEELALPTWITAPFLRTARQASTRAVAKVAWQLERRATTFEDATDRRKERDARALRIAPDRLRPFGLTYHAGEDFRTPIEGLRRISELDECGLLRPGDRLGHAVALGTDIDAWLGRNPRLYLPLSERLDNILWELDQYRGTFAVEPPPGRVERLLHIAEGVIGEVCPGSTVADFLAGRRMRHQHNIVDRLRAIGFPGKPSPTLNALDGTMRALSRTVVREPRDPLDETVDIVVTDQDVAAAKTLQRALRKRLARMEITVESNPTSNLLIGDLDTFDQHPAFVLQPLGNQVDERSLEVSINTDDPVNFATRLADEYAYVYHALVRRGASTTDALGWLERSRSASVASRFTLDISTNRAVMRFLSEQLLAAMPELNVDPPRAPR
ncbi:MAG: hypothetical protein IPK71_04015 [Myxococcales bacterium]|nr:hypothetical protein [Myxococcales bacterium]